MSASPFESDALSLPDHLSARHQLSAEEQRIRMNANQFRGEREREEEGGARLDERRRDDVS